jgi:hypothetical protein
MVVISKALLVGVVGLAFAGTAALIPGKDSETVTYERGLLDGSLDGTSLQSSGVEGASGANQTPDMYFWYYYSQNRPGCPASACSADAVFHFAR